MLSSLPGGATAFLASAQLLPFGVATTDPDGNITFANAAYAHLTGCTPDELLGQPAGEFDWKALSHAAVSSHPWSVDTACRRKNGESYTARHTFTALRNPAGEATGFWITKEEITGLKKDHESQTSPAGTSAIFESMAEGGLTADQMRDVKTPIAGVTTLSDITEHKRGEAEMEPLRSVFDNMGHGAAYGKLLFEENEPQDFLYKAVNAAFEKLTALTNVQGKRGSEVIPGIRQSNPELLHTYARVVATGNPETSEIFVAQLGVWLSVSVYRAQPEHFIAIFENISQRKTAEESLRRATEAVAKGEANLSALIESTEDLIGSVDLEYRLVTFNKALRENIQWNVGLQAGVGMRLEEWLPPERLALWPRMFERALSEGSFRAEYTLLDGRTLELSFNPIRQDCRAVGISMFGKDITARKTAEKTLREAECKYRNIFDNALEGMYRNTLQGRSLDANSALAKMLGYDSAQDFVSTVTDVAHQVWLNPDERSRCLQLLEPHGFVRGYESQFKRKDGTAVWVSVNIRRVGSPDDRTAYYEGFIEDISDRKQTADALRKSEEKFAKAFLCSPAVMVLTDSNDGLLEVSEAFAGVTGYRREEVIGRTIQELKLWSDPREFDAYRNHILIDGRVRNMEFHFQRRNGELATGLISGEPIELDGKTCRIAAILDITYRKESEQRYRDIFDGAVEGIYRTSPEGQLLAANPALATMLGYVTANEFVSAINDAAHQLWLDPNERIRCAALLEEYESVRGFETQFKRKDRTALWASINGRRVCGADGRTLYYDGFVQDITERKLMQDALRKSEEKFSTAFMSGPAMTALFRPDADGNRIIDVNAAFEQATGYRREDVIGRTSQEIRFWADPGELDDAMNKLRVDGRVRNFKYHFRKKTGEIRTGLLSTESIELDGKPCAISTTIDISEQEKAEQAIQQAHEAVAKAEAHYRLMFNSVSDALFVHKFGEDGVPSHFIEANDNACRLLGYTREEVLQMRVADIIAPEEHFSVSANADRLLADGHAIWEGRLAAEDGRRIPVEVHARVFDLNASPTIISSVRDVSERKHMQDSLRRSAETLAKLFRSSPTTTMLFKLVDNDYRIADVNEAFEQRTGYRRDEVVGQTIEEVGLWADPNEAMEYVKRFRANGKVSSFEHHFRRKNGDIGVCLSSAESIEIDGVPCAIAATIDITKQKQVEDAMQSLVTAIEHSADTIVITDLKGIIRYCNPAFEKVTGYSKEEAVGQNPRVLKSGKHAKDFYEQMWATIMQGNVWTGHLINKKKDGSFYEEDATISPIRDSSSRISGFVAVKRDVTERRELEDQLRQAQKLESIGRLAGGVAHDFNNLLTVINGYSGFLLKGLKSDDPLRSYVDEIRTAGERAASLTKQLLAFSRKQMIEPKVVDLNAIVRESTAMLQRLIGDDIALETHMDSSLGHVMADPDQIHQVIMNLAVNARDAMPDGGALDIQTLNVEVGRDDSAPIHPGGIPGRYVLMTVTDTGHGMDETIRKDIFEPFFTTKGVGKGTGLGLSTVYGIIQQNGGWIDVWSEVGVGTTFKLYLPRIDACPVAERKGISALSEGGGETILVVEDQKAVRSFAKAALRQHGYQVIEACDGDEALTVAKEHSGRIDLLLTDVVMPRMNGKELSDRLKVLRPNLKVLFISGYTADVIANRGVLDPGVAFLHKPFSQGELAEKVREVLSDPSAPIVVS